MRSSRSASPRPGATTLTPRVRHLREGRELADSIGRIDAVFRATANLTTILDLDGRREAAVEAAYDGIAVARAAGQEAVYGNFLRGNAADSLFALGRWAEAREQARIALAWSPGGIGFVNSAINLAIVEVESEAGESAGRLLGRLLLELETIRDSQYAGPAYGAAASYALWNDDAADAKRAADLAWSRVHDTEDWVLAARLAATSLEVQSVVAAAASERRDLAGDRHRTRDRDPGPRRSRGGGQGSPAWPPAGGPVARPTRGWRPRGHTGPGSTVATTRRSGTRSPSGGSRRATAIRRPRRVGARPRRPSCRATRGSAGAPPASR